jgi:hypothetical protein
MRLVLHYRGPLRSNGDALHKAEIRKVFHAQLERFWAHEPLKYLATRLDAPDGQIGHGLKVSVGSHNFVALVSSSMFAMADLRIEMLRPGAPGELLSHGGDIDNRLKTLFDALSVPQANQLPKGLSLPDPLYCLLADDRLVKSVQVNTEQLLEPVDQAVVDLTIAVRTRVSRVTMGNMEFA